ncbi:MAG: anaerobic ribonucleoside-triphosphate reductase [Candidatus Spyradocola sp.]
MSKHRLVACPNGDSKDLDYATRVIGYLKLVSSFSEDRQREEEKRHYNHVQEGSECP